MNISRSVWSVVRPIVRSVEWATGRRHYPWTSSPPHRLFARIAARARGWTGAEYRAIYGFFAGALKFRERLHADHVNHGLKLTRPISSNMLTGTAIWLHRVLTIPG